MSHHHADFLFCLHSSVFSHTHIYWQSFSFRPSWAKLTHWRSRRTYFFFSSCWWLKAHFFLADWASLSFLLFRETPVFSPFYWAEDAVLLLMFLCFCFPFSYIYIFLDLFIFSSNTLLLAFFFFPTPTKIWSFPVILYKIKCNDRFHYEFYDFPSL